VLDHLLEVFPGTVVPSIVRVFPGRPLAIFDVSHGRDSFR